MLGEQKKKERAIPVSVIKRLPIYYRYLTMLLSREVERISSRELAAKLGVTASQIRQDLSHFGNFGQRGYGYRVKELQKTIGEILGLNNNMQLVLVGAGNLGRAIVNYPNFSKRGFYFKAIFDNNEEVIGEFIGGIKVLHLDDLAGYLEENEIDIGVIATPPEAAVEIAHQLVRGGVKGIWNFAPVSLNLDKEVIVENVHISESLLTLSFRIKEKYGD